MLPEMLGEHPAREAYDRFAPKYDEFNRQNDYEVWLGEVLLPELVGHGLRVGRALDVGCGTGRAFDPLLKRGWLVAGCDVSEGMLAVAREKHRHIPLVRADARELPGFGFDFDLILALNDVVNYLTEDEDLERAFEGMKRNLAPHGLVCFDANCLSLFEANWIADREPEINERPGWEWRGLTPEAEEGRIFETEVAGEGLEACVHRERHWPRPDVEAAMEAAGLQVLAALGQREDSESILLEDPPGEHRHHKTIYIGGLHA